MPELPEVEITRRRVEPLLLGRTILRVRTTKKSYFFLTPPRRLAAGLRGRQVTELLRRGKYLLAGLDDGSTLLLHLGMTGQLFSSAVSSPRLLKHSARAALPPERQALFVADEHTHLTLTFDDGGPDLLFRDVRKFGKVLLTRAGQPNPRIDRLGVDALAVSPEHLFEKTRKRNVAIKSLLLDQAVLAGVGNIYADEALFLAGVRPRRAARKVTREQCRRLVEALDRVLLRSIETGGSSISDFVGPDGQDGHYQDERRVYARGGEPCTTCRRAITRIVVGGRSSHYCGFCQK